MRSGRAQFALRTAPRPEVGAGWEATMEPFDAYRQITAAVTPAVMVSACGLIALGLDNQIARMGLRLRDLAREHRDEGASPERRAAVAQQVSVLDRRHGLYFRALILNYGALFAFVVTSLLWLGQAVVPMPAEIPLLVFGMGLLMLAGLAVLVVAAIHLARETIEAEAAEVLGARRDPRRGTAEPSPAQDRPGRGFPGDDEPVRAGR